MRISNCDILMVVVLYKERLQDCATYQTLIRQHPKAPLFIYDNSPIAQHTQEQFDANVTYISDPCNSGLSYAYNQAAKFAKSNGQKWILLLDQDTLFPDHIIDQYIDAANNNIDIKMFTVPMRVNNYKYMSPVKVRFHTAKLSRCVPFGIVSIQKYSPINSGMMINIDAHNAVGGHNENVPLDFSDYQFVERFAKQYDSFYVLHTHCRQEFSNQTQTMEQKLQRFKIFCHCLKNCEKKGFLDKISYIYVVVKRTLSLTMSSKNLKPFSILFKHFF